MPRLVGPRPSCFDVCYESSSSKKKSAKLAKLLVEYAGKQTWQGIGNVDGKGKGEGKRGSGDKHRRVLQQTVAKY